MCVCVFSHKWFGSLWLDLGKSGANPSVAECDLGRSCVSAEDSVL